jgi:hypothetical protein
MEAYKVLFMEKGFTFNGKQYGGNSFTASYVSLVEDVLNGKHGKIPGPKTLTKMFMSTVYINYDDIPKSVKDRKLYRELGDIYVLTNKSIDGFSSAIKRISKYMSKSVIFH